jgi:hypothetical protein
MIQVTVTKEELMPILQEIRKDCSNDSPYKNGQDVQSIKCAYLNTIKVSGEKLNKIDLTRMLVVKYYDTSGELNLLHLKIPIVYKHIPNIALSQNSHI